MNIIFYISIICASMVAILLVINIFLDKYIDKKYLYIAFSILVISLGLIAFFTNPVETDDLYRHYGEIERMKLFGLSYVQNEAIYKVNFIINYLFYLISFTNNNNILPLISIIVTYALLFFVIIQICDEYKIGGRALSIFVLLHFALCPIRISISTIRITLAYSIIFLGIYREYIREKKDIATLIIYVLPLFIHSSIMIIIGIRILVSLINKFKLNTYKFILLFWFLVSNLISFVLLKMPIAILRDIGFRLNMYSDISSFGIDIRILIVQSGFLIFIYIINNIIKNHVSIKDSKIYNYIEFMQITILFTLGSIPIPVIFTRMCYFIAFLLLPTIYFGNKILAEKFHQGNRIIIWPSIIVVIGLIAHQVVNAVVYWRFWI